MSDLRKAAQQALEALENHTAIKHPQQRAYRDDAIAALRAALQDEGKQEPVAWIKTTIWGEPTVVPLYTAPPQQQEPPYWAVFEGGNVHDFFTTREMAEEMAYYKGEHATVGPLYTTPPQRPLMTDEELDQTTAQARDDLLDHIYEYGTNAEGILERVRKLSRAIERKVRGEE